MKLVLGLALLVLSAACGYSLKQTENPVLAEKGVRTIYIAPVRNATFKPGVETVLYNSLLHKFWSFKRLRTTHEIDQADAVLRVNISAATSAVSASTASSSLEPKNTGDPNFYVATHYSATLAANFALNKLNRSNKKETSEDGIWGASLSRSKTYQASTQLGVYGTTSHLINESEFDRALQDLAEQISNDAHDSMLQGF